MLEDVVEGYVSVEQAKESYGVIVHNGHIDHDATLHQRGQQLAQTTHSTSGRSGNGLSV
ncbi:MAG: hypothetical protein Ct9H300mP13_6890 [Gammaproteobacteria bacterium]|nr:MAG: hypothetical protein Ct9H300mP13_6890 [Gammaproteobacteria bacterium]